MSLDVSSRSPGVSSGIQEGSFEVANVDICLVKAPGCLWQVSRCLQRNPGGIIGCSKCQHMSCEGAGESRGVSSAIQELSFDVANLVLCLWTSPVGLQVSPAESRRYHWMSQSLWYVSGCLQEVCRCFQQNPEGIIGCHKPHGMFLDVSSGSPGLSSRIQKVSLDVVNVMVGLWISPAGLQVSLAESRRYHWMEQTSTYVLQRLQRVSTCLQQNPGGIIGCCEPCGRSLDVSSRSPGISSRIQEVSLDVVNLMVCLGLSPAGLQVSLTESRRYD